MSGFFKDLFTDAKKGFFGTTYLRDFTHASKTFRTNGYANAPKFKFLFHVYFDINTDLIKLPSNIPQQEKDRNFGVLVKSIQLPKYSFSLSTLNQYNRKRVVQTKLGYDPINIVFHDDNASLIRKMWYAYYSYYYKDSAQQEPNSKTGSQYGTNAPSNVNARNIYDNQIDGQLDWGYIGEGQQVKTTLANQLGVSKAPFFKGINIYGFNQHNFVLYRLINPVIESFSHDTYDYSNVNSTMEHQMTLQYETVKYYEGALDGTNPGTYVYNFGDESGYDKTLSPIAQPGSNATIMGQGGLVDAVGGIYDDLYNGNIIGAIQKAGVAKDTFKNPANILNIAKGEVLNNVADSLKGTPNRNNLFSFPTDGASDAISKIPGQIQGAIGQGKIISTPISKL